jgi:hypothetical protein
MPVPGVQFRKQASFIRVVSTIESEIARSANGNAGRACRVEGLWQLFTEGDANLRVFARATIIEVPAYPSFGQVLLSIRRGLPDFGRSEVGAVWVRITDALDDRQMAVVIKTLQRGQARIQSDHPIERQNLLLRSCQRWSGFKIEIVFQRNNRVQPVVSSSQLENHQNRVILPGHRLN